jgi:hypothetical protein
MGQHITLDIVDRPDLGVLRTRRQITRLSAAQGIPMLTYSTARFSAKQLSNPFTPHRLAVLTVWESRTSAEDGWSGLVAPLTAGREHWHVLGEVARAEVTGPVGPWVPDATGAERVGGNEPALVLIKGDFANAHAMDFFRGSVKTAAQLEHTAGYLGGLGLHRRVLEMTSMSCWASMKAARAYAYAAGHHADVMKRGLEEQWSTANAFMTIRPIASSGTLNAADPFRDLLPESRNADA